MLSIALLCASLDGAAYANMIQGRSVQFDPGFVYYQNRSANSVASEIEANGYKVVRYIVTNDAIIRDDLIDAFHKRKIGVWYQTFGNGFYGDAPSSLPRGWEAWKPTFIGTDENIGYTFLSLSSNDYREWKAKQILGVLAKHDFDGIEIAEPFQMGWGGPETGLYGDFSKSARERFKQQTGYDDPPDFRDQTRPSWYKSDVARYKAWTDFRVSEVNSFIKTLRDAAKAKYPKKPFSVWMLANTSPVPGQNPASLIREWQGVDAVSMAKLVKPDLVCFQTYWPDWSNPILPGDYPKLYVPFLGPLKKALPHQKVIFQADTGSLKQMRRGREWIAAFEKTCKDLGCGSTYYMYDISKWMYTERPQVRSVKTVGKRVTITFQKRIDPSIENRPDQFTVDPSVRILKVRCDGNLVICDFDRLDARVQYSLRLANISDDKSKRLYDDFPAQVASATIKFRL